MKIAMLKRSTTPQAFHYVKFEHIRPSDRTARKVRVFHLEDEDILDTRILVGSGSFARGTLGVGTSGQAYMLKQFYVDAARRAQMSEKKQKDRPPSTTYQRIRNEAFCADYGHLAARPKALICYRDKAVVAVPLLDTPILHGYLYAVRKNKTNPHVAAVYNAAVQIGNQLAELHEQGIVHNDVNGLNVMLAEEKLIIVDYGQAFFWKTASPTFGPNIFYNPPEAVFAEYPTHGAAATQKTESEKRALCKIDVWQLAMLLLNLLEMHPFDGLLKNESSREDKKTGFAALETVRRRLGTVVEEPWFGRMNDFWSKVDALPGAFGPAFRKMLASDPAERPEAVAFVEMLKAQPIPASPDRLLPWFRGRPSRWTSDVAEGFNELRQLRPYLLHEPPAAVAPAAPGVENGVAASSSQRSVVTDTSHLASPPSASDPPLSALPMPSESPLSRGVLMPAVPAGSAMPPPPPPMPVASVAPPSFMPLAPVVLRSSAPAAPLTVPSSAQPAQMIPPPSMQVAPSAQPAPVMPLPSIQAGSVMPSPSVQTAPAVSRPSAHRASAAVPPAAPPQLAQPLARVIPPSLRPPPAVESTFKRDVALGVTVGLMSMAAMMVTSYLFAPWAIAPLYFWTGGLSTGIILGVFTGLGPQRVYSALSGE